ncbi:MAG: excinuclease ABC subunit C [Halobacteriovoraceae bacterium]|nr:excinuclease ABC subunit C [Halobacteriovoraceae bacterium]
MYVYKLKSKKDPFQVYTGYTSNFKERLKRHNTGQSPHTSKYTPWEVEFVIWINSKEKAIKFEKYLKSGSGRAFCKKHF